MCSQISEFKIEISHRVEDSVAADSIGTTVQSLNFIHLNDAVKLKCCVVDNKIIYYDGDLDAIVGTMSNKFQRKKNFNVCGCLDNLNVNYEVLRCMATYIL